MKPLKDEQITDIELWHLQLPVNAPRDHGIGRVADKIDAVIVALTDSSGLTGYGEASPWSVFTGSAEASFAALSRYISPLVLGRSLADRQIITQDARQAVAHCFEAKAALETALLDLVGKRLGVGVVDLLGGAVRRQIPLSCSLANPDFDKDLELVERLLDDGVGIVKLKTGFAEHRSDLMRLETLRKRFPALRIRVDYNQGLDPFGAEAKLREVAQFRPDFIEQPVAARHFEVMRRLREVLEVPLIADESVFGLADLGRAVAQGICDGVSIKIMKSGGLTTARMMAEMAAEAGLAAYGGDMFETGLAHLAGAHMVAASPNITLGCEFYQAKYYLRQDILASPFPVVDGQVVLPDAPGLGIDPDPDMLKRHSVNQWRLSAADLS